MRVKYVGPSQTGVDLPLPDGRIVHVEHDTECEVDLPADFAGELLEQTENWKSARAKAAASAKE